jgi:hypothetical protein
LGLLAILVAIPSLDAGPSSTTAPPELSQVGAPDQAEGRRLIENLRGSGLEKDTYLEFDLTQLPRRGPEKVFTGRIWTGHIDGGSALRIELNTGQPDERRFLVRTGTSPSVWLYEPKDAASAPRLMGPETPLIPGVEMTPFELQMPFLYWPDEKLESLSRVPGLQRPAYVFLFHPPAGFVSGGPPLGSVRVYIDTQFKAPVETETFGADGRLLKTLTLVDVKKVRGQELPKEIDVRNDLTRDKTRFELTGAAVGIAIPAADFEPAALASPIEAASNASIDRFGP